jgi:hypothetical protein
VSQEKDDLDHWLDDQEQQDDAMAHIHRATSDPLVTLRRYFNQFKRRAGQPSELFEEARLALDQIERKRVGMIPSSTMKQAETDERMSTNAQPIELIDQLNAIGAVLLGLEVAHGTGDTEENRDTERALKKARADLSDATAKLRAEYVQRPTREQMQAIENEWFVLNIGAWEYDETCTLTSDQLADLFDRYCRALNIEPEGGEA